MSAWATFWGSWPLFADSVFAGAIAGGTLGLLGTYIVLRRMVFLSAALSQTAGFGVTLSFLVGFISPSLGAIALTFAVVAGLMIDNTADAARRDSYLGLAFLIGSAGTLAVGTRIVQEMQDIQTLLFGTAVAVVPADLLELGIVCGAMVALHIWWRRGFTQIAVDRVDAKVRGLPVRVLELLLLGSIAVVISVVTRVLGALPAFAFSVLPAMAALRVARNVDVALVFAALLGVVSGVVGYYVAFAWDLPVGASQTLVAVAAFAAMAALGAVMKR